MTYKGYLDAKKNQRKSEENWVSFEIIPDIKEFKIKSMLPGRSIVERSDETEEEIDELDKREERNGK